MRCLLLASLFFFVGQYSFAKKWDPKPLGKAHLSIQMQSIRKDLKALFPYMYSHQSLKNDQNKKLVLQKVGNLIEKVSEVAPHLKGRPVTFSHSHQILVDHLKKLKTVLEKGNFAYGSSMLKQTPNVCTSCHLQDQKKKAYLFQLERSSFQNDFEFAEFNFATRNYDQALDYYNRYLSSENKSATQTSLALQRGLTTYIQVLQDYEGAVSWLQSLNEKNFLPKHIKKDLQGWIKGLNTLKKEAKLRPDPSDWTKIKELADQLLKPVARGGSFDLTPKDIVNYIHLGGLLFQGLKSAKNKADTPKRLYYLSIIDRSLNYSYFFSMSDLYLKECVFSYSSDPYAQKCFQEYRDYMTYSFSGSHYSELPDDIKAELKKMESKLKKAAN